MEREKKNIQTNKYTSHTYIVNGLNSNDKQQCKAVTMQCTHENQLHWLRIEKMATQYTQKTYKKNWKIAYKKRDKHGL